VGGLTAGGSPLDREAVRNQLVTMRNAVDQLSAAGPLDRARLADDPASGLVVERLLALLADLAFDISRAGLIDERLAVTLAPLDGPHHLLVQQYLDTEPERVAGVVADAVAAYREYVRQVDRAHR
jgi:uncharacterized protein YutE (UPF0331/DUF86 family)